LEVNIVLHDKAKTLLGKAAKATVTLLVALCLSSLAYAQADDLNRLIQRLKADSFDRYDVTQALKKMRDPRAVEPLIAALRDRESALLRGRSAWALGEIKDPRAVEPLIALLNHWDKYVRMRAAWILGKLQDSRAVEPLISALLKDAYTGVARNAARALGEIKDRRAVEPLIAALKDRSSSVRENASEALGEMEDTRAAKPLLAALEDKDWEIIASAYRFYIRRGEAGTETILIEALKRTGRVEMAKRFLSSGNGQLIEAAKQWAGEQGVDLKLTGDRTGPKWGRGQ
jgi:HEAT repeat protein